MMTRRNLMGCLAGVALLAAGVVPMRADMVPLSQQARFEALADKLFAPCCYSESVRVHRSAIAVQMRGEIATMMAQGKTDRQILDVYVGKYGERVLMIPEGQKRQWLFVIPAVMLLLGGLIVLFVLRRMKRAPAPATVAATGGPTVEVKDSDLEW